MNALPTPTRHAFLPPEAREARGGADLFDDAAHVDDDEAEAAEHADALDGDKTAAHARCPAGESRAALATCATDEQLAAWLARVAQRDERALAALYDATLSRVYGLVLRVVRKPAVAEEVVEDTYFQVWRQALRFDPERGRAMTWLLAMARSRAIDALRHEARFQHDSLDDEQGPEIVGDTPAVDELLAAARGHADLHRALLKLHAQPRQLVSMAFFRGLSHEEIASQTALPLGTVKSQIRRALATLQTVLGEGSLQGLAS